MILPLWSCHTLRQDAEFQLVAPLETAWHESRLRADLEFLADPTASEFSPATEYSHAAAYVAAQMHGLQPALGRSAVVGYNVAPAGTGYNVMGYAAGSHPAQASELVIVAADLDDSASHQGIAALMEIARNYGTWEHRGFSPARTIMVAAFSGCQEGCSGLHAYLRRPLWPVGNTRALVYLAPSDSAAVADALAPRNVALHVLTSEPPEAASSLDLLALDAAQLALEAHAIVRVLAGSE